MTFEETENGQLTDRMIKSIENSFPYVVSAHDENHTRNLYKLITNIRGNLKVIHEGRKNVAANMVQLNDNLMRLWKISKTNLMLVKECQILFSKNYNWATMNKLISSSPVADKVMLAALYRDYEMVLQYCNYTDEEILELVTIYPYLSSIYTGSDQLIKSIGALLQ